MISIDEIVESNYAEKRLDLFLSIVQNQVSRSQVKRSIQKGKVRVNGIVQFKANYKVKEGENIQATLESTETPPPEIKPYDYDLKVIYEDKDLLAINKPSGMVTHPATGNWDKTLLNAVVAYHEELANVGSEGRMGLIHRLDKDTSGIILIGKTNLGLWHFSKQFAQRKVNKTYTAVVKGDFGNFLSGKESIRIDTNIKRNKVNRKRFQATTDSLEGKKASTIFSSVQKLSLNGETYSMIKARPITGRTHQIRVHLKYINFPILGDEIYNSKERYERLMLHATRLVIEGIKGQPLDLSAETPACFLNLDKPKSCEKFIS